MPCDGRDDDEVTSERARGVGVALGPALGLPTKPCLVDAGLEDVPCDGREDDEAISELARGVGVAFGPVLGLPPKPCFVDAGFEDDVTTSDLVRDTGVLVKLALAPAEGRFDVPGTVSDFARGGCDFFRPDRGSRDCLDPNALKD